MLLAASRQVDKDVNDVPFTIEVQIDAATVHNDRLPHNSTHVLEEITAEAHGDVQSVEHDDELDTNAFDLEQVTLSVALTSHHAANSSHDASHVTITSQPHTSKNVHNDLDLWARIKEYDQRAAKEGFTQVLSKKQQLNMKEKKTSPLKAALSDPCKGWSSSMFPMMLYLNIRGS